MQNFHRKQITHSDSPSSPSLALSSSNTPAQVVGSPSNDAASVKGKLKRLFRRDGCSHTDMLGDVAAMTSSSESPALQSNKISATTSQPLASAHATTSKDNDHVADTSSGNKTTNAAAILGIVQAICEVLDNVPYVKVVTGVASTAIKVIEEVDTCKGEWDQVKVTLLKVHDTVFKYRHGVDDSMSLPDDVKAAF
ncbi:hypothetical protein F5146DRAFT_123904 [Armillaria mellea]|nr:hypothetical protein F5146DRAFT_123904 [Armillaria mellea]